MATLINPDTAGSDFQSLVPDYLQHRAINWLLEKIESDFEGVFTDSVPVEVISKAAIVRAVIVKESLLALYSNDNVLPVKV